MGRVALAAAAAAPSPALAQHFNSHVHLDQMQPASAGSPFLQAEGPLDRFDEGIAYGFRIVMDYAYAPLRAEVLHVDDAPDKIPVEHAMLLHAGASLSPVDWLNLELDMPFAVHEAGEDVADEAGNPLVLGQNLSAGEAGQGDLRIGVHFRLAIVDDVALSFGARVWAPTGSRDAYLRGPSPRARFELVAAAAGNYEALLYGCTLGLSPLWFGAHDGDRIAIDCALHGKVAPFVSLGFEPHFAAFTYPPRAVGADEQGEFPGLGSNTSFAIQFEPLAVARFHIAVEGAGNFAVGVAGGPGIGHAPGTAGGRALLTLTYADRGERPPEVTGIRDADLDGILDEDDECPHQAGPEDRKGCPGAVDSDGDGIAEGDACPDQAGARYNDPKANGCPDQDNDRIADPVDPCINEPGEKTGGCPKFARLVEGDFKIDPPIGFARNAASLSPEAIEALKEVIVTMRANPNIPVVSVAVGTKRASPRLSDDRAKVILDFFVEQNFDASRYEVPLDDEVESGKIRVHIQK